MKHYFTNLLLSLFTATMVAQTPQTVIVEHFTNTLCGICSSRNPGFYEILDDYPDVLHIAYHPSSPYSSCVFNQHNSWENDQRTYFYDIYGSTPKVVVQGDVLPVQNPLIKPEQIDAKLGQTSEYELLMTKIVRSTNSSTVSIEIQHVSGPSIATVLVYAGLAEKEIEYNAPNGEDMHHDVFRKVIFYDTLNFSFTGQKRTIERNYDTHVDWDEEQIYAFAVLHDINTSEVVQSGTTLSSPSSTDDKHIAELSSVFYPNPASGIIRLQDEYANKFVELQLYDMVGNEVKQINNPTELNLADLPEGMYFVKLTDRGKRQYSTKILKTLR